MISRYFKHTNSVHVYSKCVSVKYSRLKCQWRNRSFFFVNKETPNVALQIFLKNKNTCKIKRTENRAERTSTHFELTPQKPMEAKQNKKNQEKKSCFKCVIGVTHQQHTRGNAKRAMREKERRTFTRQRIVVSRLDTRRPRRPIAQRIDNASDGAGRNLLLWIEDKKLAYAQPRETQSRHKCKVRKQTKTPAPHCAPSNASRFRWAYEIKTPKAQETDKRAAAPKKNSLEAP